LEFKIGRDRGLKEEEEVAMEAAMDLMRRMPPAECQQALASLLALLPSQSPELLSRVDQPLQVLFWFGVLSSFLAFLWVFFAFVSDSQ
jgi:predicted DNA-binding transcriptional regulator YafY